MSACAESISLKPCRTARIRIAGASQHDAPELANF
jgi:hypothetical protein